MLRVLINLCFTDQVEQKLSPLNTRAENDDMSLLPTLVGEPCDAGDVPAEHGPALVELVDLENGCSRNEGLKDL